VKICISDGVELVIVVQGRDTVRSIMQLVEARTGAPPSQQRISFSGRFDRSIDEFLCSAIVTNALSDAERERNL
jgi:hypothetical protein